MKNVNRHIKEVQQTSKGFIKSYSTYIMLKLRKMEDKEKNVKEARGKHVHIHLICNRNIRKLGGQETVRGLSLKYQKKKDYESRILYLAKLYYKL